VYIPVPAGGSPVTIQHGQIHARVITWLGIYHANTAGSH
jgi:hypothetical protein